MRDSTDPQKTAAQNVDIDFGNIEDDTPLEVDPKERSLKTEKKDTPVETLYNWWKRNKIDLQPEFQRFFVWDKAKASRLVESLLINIPIPVIYVAAEQDGTYDVVDGQQRLTSIFAFIDGRMPDGKDFMLSGLQVLTELNGKAFGELESSLQEAIMESTLRLIVIEKDSHPDVKFEVFERLNLGSVKLNDQELRNCVYRGNYNELLAELANNKHLLKIRGAEMPDTRMRDRQLILRFFAMWRNTHLRYKGPMKHFLNREMDGRRQLSEREMAEMRLLFEKSIEMAYLIFGENAFRRYRPGRDGQPHGYWEKNRLNVALWDTVLYTFGFYQRPQVVPVADRIREEYLDIVTNDPRFVEYIASTGDKVDRVRYRADEWRRRMEAVVSTVQQGPRTFSLALKEQLWKANPTCQLCSQRIHDIDDAEVDHIEHYWRGGKTIPENARLTHRYCNRVRGER
jgi:5-methylcytosine-specific restriction endonuclease McrA